MAQTRKIHWPNVITVASIGIFLATEAFGLAFAASWAVSSLAGIGGYYRYGIDAVFFAIALAGIVRFMRSAARIEPMVD